MTLPPRKHRNIHYCINSITNKPSAEKKNTHTHTHKTQTHLTHHACHSPSQIANDQIYTAYIVPMYRTCFVPPFFGSGQKPHPPVSRSSANSPVRGGFSQRQTRRATSGSCLSKRWYKRALSCRSWEDTSFTARASRRPSIDCEQKKK